MSYLLIGIGGALGSVARYWCSLMAAAKVGGSFPWGTIMVNIIGSFLIGAAMGGLEAGGRWQVSPVVRDFVNQFFMIGVLGGYTTFSSFSLQTLNLLREQHWMEAGINVMLSVALCLVAVWLGYVLSVVLSRT